MQTSPIHIYQFGDFELDAVKRILRRLDGAPVALTPRVFDTLLYMVEHHAAVLDKERIMEAVWPDSIVEENNLAQAISKLRQVLGETPDLHNYIVTVPGRGYRFVAEVKERSPGEFFRAKEGDPAIQTSDEKGTGAVSEIERYQLPAKTRRLFVFAVAVIVIVGVAVAFFARSHVRNSSAQASAASSAPAQIPEKSVAVLPFENLSDDKQNAYFAAGVQDEILTALARIADLKVISRTSVMEYKSGIARDLREIGQQLGVAHVMEGSVQRSGNRVRVNAQLVDARTDAHLWAQTYDGDLRDVFAIQSEIARSIADQLQARISAGEKAAIARPLTTDVVANTLYQQALGFEHQPPEEQTLRHAVQLLEEAVKRDPRFALAYCALSQKHMSLYFSGYDHNPARREQANVALQRAAQIQPDAGEVHLAAAEYWFHGFLDYDRARAEIELARRSLPNNVKVYVMSAAMDRRQARWSEAIINFERATELDPRDLESVMNTAFTYEGLHLYSDATRMYERAAALPFADYLPRIAARSFQALNERADIRPLRAELNAILAEHPNATPKIADYFWFCAIIERDRGEIERALAAIPAEGLYAAGNFVRPREWYIGYAARMFGEAETARAAFTTARSKLKAIVEEQPDYAAAWSLLGQVDAALDRKEEAVREGRRACELMPLSKDAWFGPDCLRSLAKIYAWIGEKDLAVEQLQKLAAQVPGFAYGELKLDPDWDPLRGDPRFEKIVASLAPKQ